MNDDYERYNFWHIEIQQTQQEIKTTTPEEQTTQPQQEVQI